MSIGVMLFRCFSDVKTAVWIFISTGMTTGLDLEILLENSGLVMANIFKLVQQIQAKSVASVIS